MGLRRRQVRFLQEKRAALGPVEEGRRDLESLVLWERKTFGSMGLYCSVPIGEMGNGGNGIRWAGFAGSLCPALTVSL